jgi:hypothetical protein
MDETLVMYWPEWGDGWGGVSYLVRGGDYWFFKIFSNILFWILFGFD